MKQLLCKVKKNPVKEYALPADPVPTINCIPAFFGN